MDLHLFSNTIGIDVVADTLLSRADISVADYHCPIHSVPITPPPLQAGHERESESYFAATKTNFNELREQAMAAQSTPEFFRPVAPPAPPASRPAHFVSAPVSREVPTGNPKPISPERVVLSVDEQDVAKASGISMTEYTKHTNSNSNAKRPQVSGNNKFFDTIDDSSQQHFLARQRLATWIESAANANPSADVLLGCRGLSLSECPNISLQPGQITQGGTPLFENQQGGVGCTHARRSRRVCKRDAAHLI